MSAFNTRLRSRPLRRRRLRRPPLIVIEVSGGLVQQVYSSEQRVQVVGIDFDAQDCTPDDGVLTVADRTGREYSCFASQWRPLSTAKLPVETREAVRLTLGRR